MKIPRRSVLLTLQHHQSFNDDLEEEPVPGLEGVAGPFEEITFHGDAVVSVHIVLELGVIV